jgi:hypothetical protein
VHQVVPQDAPAEAHHGTTCNCIGSCTAASFALAPIAHQVAARVPLTPSIPTWPSHDASLELAPVASLLPPATAPPVA